MLLGNTLVKLSAMNYFRKTIKRYLSLWAILLSLALLFAQGVKLHVHELAHGHEQHRGHIAAAETLEHSHLSVAHLSSDISHSDHHQEVLSEIDASQDGIQVKMYNGILLPAILAIFFTLILPGFYRFTFHTRRANDKIIPWRYHISPPLRAPPL